jgi:hypothetical protein
VTLELETSRKLFGKIKGKPASAQDTPTTGN